jgi:hypothetical protein
VRSTSSYEGAMIPIYLANGTVNGKFIPLTWDYKTQNETELDYEAIAAGGSGSAGLGS